MTAEHGPAAFEGSVRALAEERQAHNATTISLTLGLSALATALLLFVLPSHEDFGLIQLSLVASAAGNLIAYFVVKKGLVAPGTLLMIATSLLQHVAVASFPTATMVTPFFAPIFIMIASACVGRSWLMPVSVLAALAITAQWQVGRHIGISDEALQRSYPAAFVLLSVTSVVAWLYTRGIERAVALAQDRENQRQDLFLQMERVGRLEALGRLSGGIAHDFNNFLAVIRGSAELAEDAAKGDPEILEELAQIRMTTDRAAALTAQLLAFSKSRITPPTRLKPQERLEGLLPLLRRLCGAQLVVRTRLHAPEAEVLASPSQFEQVVMNLIANARDACPDGGTITLSLGNVQVDPGSLPLAPGPYVELTVEDTGMGIPNDVKEHIFEPFYSTKAPGRGTGLGLSTSFSIARHWGGTIVAGNRAIGGAIFRVLLPLAEVGSEPDEKEPRGEKPVTEDLPPRGESELIQSSKHMGS